MQQVRRIIIVIFLLESSVTDIKMRCIHGEHAVLCGFITGGMLAFEIIRNIFVQQGRFAGNILFLMLLQNVASFLPGMASFLIAKLTSQMGIGDALALLLLGSAWHLEQEMQIIFVSLILAGAYGAFRLWYTGRKEKIPYIPFLTMGVIVYGFL